MCKLNADIRNSHDAWWYYEPPPTAYDLISDNALTNLLRPILYVAMRMYFQYCHRLIVSGYNPSYAKQSCIIVANHSSHLDTPLLFSCFPFKNVNTLRAVAALDYFFNHTITRVVTHLLCNIIPISRKSADFISFSLCERIIKAGSSIIVYPEGTRTRDGKMGDFKAGIGILVKKTRVPVLPVYIQGTYECLNYKRLLPRRGVIRVRFGEPIVLSEQQLRDMNYRDIAECLRTAIIALV